MLLNVTNSQLRRDVSVGEPGAWRDYFPLTISEGFAEIDWVCQNQFSISWSSGVEALMEIGDRVPKTPFFPRAASYPFTVEMLEQCRKGVSVPGYKSTYCHSIFYFGRRNENVLADRYTFSFEVDGPEPTGALYSSFRRQALAYIARSVYDKKPVPIILASEFGMDFLGYLIVRWLIDDHDCIFSEALEAFSAAVPGGIRHNRTFRALYNIYRHNPAQKLELRSLHEQALAAGVSDKVLAMGVCEPPEPDLTEVQLEILSNSVFALRRKQQIEQMSSTLHLEQVSEFDVAPVIPVVEQEPVQNESPAAGTPPAAPPTTIECPVLKYKRVPEFENIGEPVEPKVCARFITALNRRLDQMKTCAPFSPMKSIDKATIECVKADQEHIYSLIPIPHGLRCLLSFKDGETVLISESSVGRRVESGLAIGESLIEGYLCCAIDSESLVFVVSDVVIFSGEDMRKKSYIDRLSIVRSMSQTGHSDFRIDFVSTYPLAKFDDILFQSEEITFPVAGMCITRLDLPSGIGGDIAMFFWKITRRVKPVVLVRFLRDEMKCIGLVQERSSMRDVVDFGVAKPNLVALDGTCVDLRYNHDQRQWQIIGTSTASKPWSYSQFNKLADDGPPYSYEGIKACIEDIVNTDSRYR